MYHVTFSLHAEHPPPVQPSLVVDWPFYNSKSSKPNDSASPFKKKKKNF